MTAQEKPTTLMDIGDIFSVVLYDYRGNKTSHYKVVGFYEPGFSRTTWSYNVIKCTKTGKEFKARNGYSASIDKALVVPAFIPTVDRQVNYRIVKRATTIGEKANIENGLITGGIRRRLDYLKARIENDKKELGKLEVNLANLENEEYLQGWKLYSEKKGTQEK